MNLKMSKNTRDYILEKGKSLHVWDHYSGLIQKNIFQIGVFFKHEEQPAPDIAPCLFWPIHWVEKQSEVDEFIKINGLENMKLVVSNQYKAA